MHAYRATTAASRRWHTAYTTLRTLRPAAIDAFNTRHAHTLGGARLHDQPGPGLVIEHGTRPDGCRPYPWSQAGAPAPMWVPDRRTRLGRAYADQIADLPESPGALSIHRILGPMGAMPGPGRAESNGATVYLLDRFILDDQRYDLWDGAVPGLDPAVWQTISPGEFEDARREHDFRARHYTVTAHIEVLARRSVAEQSQDLHRGLVSAARAAHAGVRGPQELHTLETAMAGASELLDQQYYPGLSDAQVRPRVQDEIDRLHQLAA